MTDDELSRMINNKWHSRLHLTKIGYYWYDAECWRCSKTIENEIKDTDAMALTRWPNVSDVSWACTDCCNAMSLQAYGERDEYLKAMRTRS